MRIAISKGDGHEKYRKYISWLTAMNNESEMIELSAMSNSDAASCIQSIDGIVFTGGSDIDSSRYGMSTTQKTESIDTERDAREFQWFDRALNMGMPILGICRGMQLINVALGGTLVSDIASTFPNSLAHIISETEDASHKIAIEPDSMLKEIQGGLQGDVNSSHHQSIDTLASELRVVARSSDGIIEAVEWKNRDHKSFLLGVQWHPERMKYENKLSAGIANAFLIACEKYKEEE